MTTANSNYKIIEAQKAHIRELENRMLMEKARLEGMLAIFGDVQRPRANFPFNVFKIDRKRKRREISKQWSSVFVYIEEMGGATVDELKTFATKNRLDTRTLLAQINYYTKTGLFTPPDKGDLKIHLTGAGKEVYVVAKAKMRSPGF